MSQTFFNQLTDLNDAKDGVKDYIFVNRWRGTGAPDFANAQGWETTQVNIDQYLQLIENPISNDAGNVAYLGTDSKIYVPAPPTPPPSTFERESDFQSPYQYCGYAPAGSLTSQAVWEIDRITVNLDGTVLVQSASNVAWDNRTSVIYS